VVSLTINELVERAHANAKEKGFWDEPRETGTLLMLIVSEVTEALDAHSCENFCEELADICIRIFDLCGGHDIDLKTVLHSMRHNYEFVSKDIDLNLTSFADLEDSLSVADGDFDDDKLSISVVKSLSYALERDRQGLRGPFAQKIAMAFVYTLKWAAHKGYRIEDALMKKMERNKQRPRLHGKKY